MPECRDCERVGKDKKEIGRKKVIVCLVEGKHSSHIIIIIAFQSSRKEILDLNFDLFYYLFKFFSSSFSLLSLPRSPLFRFPIHSWVHVCCYYQMFMHAKYYIMHKWNIEDCELFTVFFLPFFLASPFFPSRCAAGLFELLVLSRCLLNRMKKQTSVLSSLWMQIKKGWFLFYSESGEEKYIQIFMYFLYVHRGARSGGQVTRGD